MKYLRSYLESSLRNEVAKDVINDDDVADILDVFQDVIDEFGIDVVGSYIDIPLNSEDGGIYCWYREIWGGDKSKSLVITIMYRYSGYKKSNNDRKKLIDILGFIEREFETRVKKMGFDVTVYKENSIVQTTYDVINVDISGVSTKLFK